MNLKRLALFALAFLAVAAGCLSAQPAAEQSLSQIENLWETYHDPLQNHQARAQALEQIIAAYQQLLEEQAPAPATVRQILDGRIQWHLALTKALLIERSRQARLAVEDLGLTGPWVEDLAKTMQRAQPVLDQADQVLQRISAHMRADQDFERNYVVTGLFLRANQARNWIDYYRGWTAYYRAQLTGPGPVRQELLQSAIDHLRRCCVGEPGEPAGQSPQADLRLQAVLLMSKALRLAGRLDDATKLLDWVDRQSLDQQTAYLAALQRCRLLRDRGDHDDALDGLDQIRNWCRKKETIRDLPVQLTLAYLECTIRSAQARQALDRGDLARARRLSRKRLEPLEKIFDAQKDRQIRDIVYEQIRNTQLTGPPADDAPALELLAVAVGLARQNQTAQALELYDRLLARGDSLDDHLQAETLWQAGSAAQNTDPLRACAYFGRLADDLPNAPQARQGALLAAHLASTLSRDHPQDPAAEQACFVALQRLINKYPAQDQAGQWRLYWADLLRTRGRLAEAAEQFGKIPATNSHFVQAGFYRLDCQRQLLDDGRSETPLDKSAQFDRLAEEYLNLDRYVRDPASPAAHRDKSARQFAARARLAAARIYSLHLGRPQTSLKVLDGFADHYPELPELFPTAARYRIVALTRTDQLTEAAALSLQLIRDGRPDAPQVADALLLRIRDKFPDGQAPASAPSAQTLAESWRELAAARLELLRQTDSPPQEKEQALLQAQDMLGRACFAAGELDQALQTFNELDRKFSNSAEYVRMLARIHLARKDYPAAARRWRRLIQGLPDNSPEWFDAWYWALRTNFEAGAERQQIARRIKQLRQLDAQMGSDQTRTRFEAMLKELEG